MQQSYITLHQMGYAHSVETYYGGKLVGGLYGVSLGKAFFGESMFYIAGCFKGSALLPGGTAKTMGLPFHRCPAVDSPYEKMGAEEIPRKEFLLRLKKSLEFPTRRGKWE